MVIIYCCWGGHFKKRTMRIEIYLAISFFLLVLFIYVSFFLSFLFLLSSLPSFVFFLSAFGGSPHRPPPPPQIRHWIYPAISFFLLVLFIYFSFFLSFLFLLSSFSSFVFFLSAFKGGGSPHRPPPQIRHWIYLAISFFLLVLFIYFSFFLSFLFLLSSFPSFLFFLSAFGGGGGAIAPIPPPQIRHWYLLKKSTISKLCRKLIHILLSLFNPKALNKSLLNSFFRPPSHECSMN